MRKSRTQSLPYLIQPLEPRRMLSFNTSLNTFSRVFYVGGGPATNNIVLSKSGANYKFVDGNQTVSIPASEVKGIVVNLGSGNDKFTTTNSFTFGVTVNGESGNDTITGGGGADSLDGGSENDRISGGDGNDTIRGSVGDDNLSGNAGKDQIYDDLGKDSCYGGSGNDTLHAGIGSSDPDLYDGGDGTDMMDYVARDGGRSVGVTITNDGVANDGAINSYKPSPEKDNVLPNIENFQGTYKDDRIILTGSGNNYIYALYGNDYVVAGAGNDTLNLSLGNDDGEGGDGNDTIYCGDGDDVAYGGMGNDSLDGYDGADVLSGEAGSDTMTGDNGNDSLYGGDGPDSLIGGAGADRFSGGNDNDILVAVDQIPGERVDGGSGFDVAYIDKLPSNFYPFYTPLDSVIGVEQVV